MMVVKDIRSYLLRSIEYALRRKLPNSFDCRLALN